VSASKFVISHLKMTPRAGPCSSHAIQNETASTRRRVSSDYERGDRPAYQRPPRVHAPRSLASLGPLPFPRDASDNTTTNRPGPPPHLVLSPFHNLHHQRSFTRRLDHLPSTSIRSHSRSYTLTLPSGTSYRPLLGRGNINFSRGLQQKG
jgi:hypothetical protein